MPQSEDGVGVERRGERKVVVAEVKEVDWTGSPWRLVVGWWVNGWVVAALGLGSQLFESSVGFDCMLGFACRVFHPIHCVTYLPLLVPLWLLKGKRGLRAGMGRNLHFLSHLDHPATSRFVG